MTRKPLAEARIILIAFSITAIPPLFASAARAQKTDVDRFRAKPSSSLAPGHASQEIREYSSRSEKASSTMPGIFDFLPPVTYSSGNGAWSVAVADLNGDGTPDMVVSGETLSNSIAVTTVGVLLGNGNGTFQPVVDYAAGGPQVGNITVADVNGDGKPDIVVVSNGGVSILLGNGDGTFQPAVTYEAPASSVAVADVNGDGKADLVVSINEGADQPGLGILLGNGDGTFQPVVEYSVGISAQSVAVADINGDGNADVVLGGYADVAQVAVLLGNGNGTFQPAVLYDSGGSGWPSSIAIADLNGDGNLDLAVANYYTSTTGVGVFLGNGDGTFQSVVNYDSGGPLPWTITIADVNLDGNPDLVVANYYGPVGVLLGNGNGTFQLPIDFATGGAAVWVAAVDVNGDGRPDLEVANGITGVNVLLNTDIYVTSTSLTSSINPSIYGQTVTLTATVTGRGGPTGNISFVWGGNTMGTAPLNSNGIATFITANLNADTYPLTAIYKGDANHLGSTSAVLNQVVKQTTSSATLTSSPNPSNVGQSVIFTAKILSPTVKARGPVTFTAGNTVLGMAQLGWNNEATLSLSSLPAGSTTVTATYDGDSNIKGSSASVTQVVQ
jgi:hypothetical protein